MRKNGCRRWQMSKWEIFWMRVRLSYWFRYIRYGILPRLRRPFMPTIWRFKRWYGKKMVAIFDHRCTHCGRWQIRNWDYVFGMCHKCFELHDACFGGRNRANYEEDENASLDSSKEE